MNKPFVTVYKPIAGWKSVLMTWDTEYGGYSPWNTGMFAYRTREEAVRDAKSWAEAEDIEFKD